MSLQRDDDRTSAIRSIECESKAKGLAVKIEKLSYVVALFAVAVCCVGVAGGGNDLEAEGCDTCCRLALKMKEKSRDGLEGAVYPFP